MGWMVDDARKGVGGEVIDGATRNSMPLFSVAVVESPIFFFLFFSFFFHPVFLFYFIFRDGCAPRNADGAMHRLVHTPSWFHSGIG
jgi:hypothetical protein